VPVTRANFTEVHVLLYYLENEHNKTKWQFQVLEPHVITAEAVTQLRHWKAEYYKKVHLHDPNFTLRCRLDRIGELAQDIVKLYSDKTSPTSTQPTQIPQSPLSPQIVLPLPENQPIQVVRISILQLLIRMDLKLIFLLK
jgi:hypothetical protein